MRISKGGELALVLGATFPEVKAVVAYSPSGFVCQGNPGSDRSSWTFRGAPLPFYRVDPRRGALQGFLDALQDPKNAITSAAIPVERTRGPILLISGKQDTTWPSTPLADMVIKRLAASGHPYPYNHLAYE